MDGTLALIGGAIGSVLAAGGGGLLLKTIVDRVKVVESKQGAKCANHNKMVSDFDKRFDNFDELLLGSKTDPSKPGLVPIVQNIDAKVDKIIEHHESGGT